MDKSQKQKILQELGGIPEEVYNALVEELLKLIDSQKNSLLQALEKKDTKSVQTLAHSIKGAAGNLRIMSIFEYAKALECITKDSVSTEAIEQGASALLQEYEQFKQEWSV